MNTVEVRHLPVIEDGRPRAAGALQQASSAATTFVPGNPDLGPLAATAPRRHILNNRSQGGEIGTMTPRLMGCLTMRGGSAAGLWQIVSALSMTRPAWRLRGFGA